MIMGFVLRLVLWFGGVGWVMVVMVFSVFIINDLFFFCCVYLLVMSSMYKV